MTDDLEMEAIPQYTAGENPAPQAFLAGNDLLLCSEPGDSFHALLKAVEAGEIAEERLDASMVIVSPRSALSTAFSICAVVTEPPLTSIFTSSPEPVTLPVLPELEPPPEERRETVRVPFA